jgi:hypothetical protein
MRRLALPAAAVLAVLTLVACGGSPDTGDFRDKAEDFIEEDESELTASLSNTFDDATCEEPAATDIGTTFTCSATGADGQPYQFAVEIVGERQIAVSPPASGATTTTTTTVAG